MLDFTLDLHTDQIRKIGYYSRSSDRDATREEVLLWQRVMELEGVFESMRPDRVKDLLSALPTAEMVSISAGDFAALRQYAPDRVRILTDPILNSRRILGEVPRMEDGSPSTTYLVVDRSAVNGSPQPCS